MFVKKKRNRSGSTSVVVASKHKGSYREHLTVGISSDNNETVTFVEQGKARICKQEALNQRKLNLFGEESAQKRNELEETAQVLSNISNVLII